MHTYKLTVIASDGIKASMLLVCPSVERARSAALREVLKAGESLVWHVVQLPTPTFKGVYEARGAT
jgi:hypothetical protein